MTSARDLSLAIDSLKKAKHIASICNSYDDVQCAANGPRIKVALKHLQEANRLMGLVYESITAWSN